MIRALDANGSIRVLLVEDSPSQRTLLLALLEADARMRVVGTAGSGDEAIVAAERLRPDVIAMDIVLPGVDGYEATRQIMQRCPTRVVLMSSDNAAIQRSVDALAAGALAVVRKPGSLTAQTSAADRTTLLTTLRLMSSVPVITRHAPRTIQATKAPTRIGNQPQVLAIAASTGGPLALQTVLRGLGSQFPLPVLVVQHIARGFTSALVDWLRSTVPLPVAIAAPLMPLQSGHVYIAPDDQHLIVHLRGVAAVASAMPDDHFCPSADKLFNSIAQVYGNQALGVVLTGMGDDGARGFQALAAAGSLTLAQDEASSVVYGMPRAAAASGAVLRVAALDDMASAICDLVGHIPSSAVQAGYDV